MLKLYKHWIKVHRRVGHILLDRLGAQCKTLTQL